MNTETAKAAAAYHMIEKARELLQPEPALDSIIQIESVILAVEIHLSKRSQPFTDEEWALLSRLERILKRAKEIYLNT